MKRTGMPKTTRLIDSHQHVFWHGRDDRGLIQDLDDHGIEYAWLLSWEIPPSEDNEHYHRVLNPLNARPDGPHAGITLRASIETRDRYPDRFVLGYCPPPIFPSAPQLLEAALVRLEIGQQLLATPLPEEACRGDRRDRQQADTEDPNGSLPRWSYCVM